MRQIIKVVKGIMKHPLAKRQKSSSILRFVKWQIAQAILPYPVVYSFVGDSKLVVQKGMHGATGNIYLGLHEFNEMSFVLHLLKEGDLFGDIGANIGAFSVLASVNAGADAITVEPIPVTYGHLVRNVKVNNAESKITALQLGVGNENTTLRFTKNMDTVNSVSVNQDTNDENTVLVQVKKLDDIFNDRQPVLLKIDVEGYEWQVLQGAKNIFNNDGLKAVIMEINGSGKSYGIDDNKIHEYMLGLNFLPYGYNPFSKELKPLNTYGDDNTIYIRDIEWVKKRILSSKKYTIAGQGI